MSPSMNALWRYGNGHMHRSAKYDRWHHDAELGLEIPAAGRRTATDEDIAMWAAPLTGSGARLELRKASRDLNTTDKPTSSVRSDIVCGSRNNGRTSMRGSWCVDSRLKCARCPTFRWRRPAPVRCAALLPPRFRLVVK